MLSIFCLRLAGGLAGSLLLLFPLDVQPRFYRVHFLIILALTLAGALFLAGSAGPALWIALGLGLLGALLGALTWSLEGSPGGWLLAVLCTAAPAAALGVLSFRGPGPDPEALAAGQTVPHASPGWLWADDLTSAALLGVATTAMLMGHSYLIAPTMSLTPLLRLLTALFAALAVRLVVAAVGLAFWTRGHSWFNLEEDTALWLPLRWGLGFLAPMVLGWMARAAARIRSTQSATGILYVVVIFCCLGELTGQVLLRSTGHVL